MGRWTKYFADGTQYIGTDIAVKNRLASWQYSQLTNMIGVDLEDNEFKLCIQGTGNYWQSDTYHSIFPGPEILLVKRRIEKQINNLDKYFCYYREGKCQFALFNGNFSAAKLIAIPSVWHNKWFVLEYNLRDKQYKYYIKDHKI